MEVVASLSQGRTPAAQCGLFTHKSVPVIFEPPCTPNFVETINVDFAANSRLYIEICMITYCFFNTRVEKRET